MTVSPTLTPGARKRAARKAAASPRTTRRSLKIIAGYLRLSVDPNGDKIGYDVQRDAIQQWADQNGYEVVWFQDKDLSAADGKVRRPQYEEMLARMAAGEFAGLVVWKLDRLVRRNRDFLACHEIVKEAGAFIATTQEFSNPDSTSEILMQLLVIVAEIEINQMRIRALAHQQLRAEKGLVSGVGDRVFGFVGVDKDEATKKTLNPSEALIKHNPKEARLLREAARRIVHEGAGYQDIVKDWNTRNPPVLGARGKPWEYSKLQRLMTSARVAGLREHNEYDEDGNLTEVTFSKATWKPIIDRQTWDALRSKRQPFAAKTTSGEYLFTGGVAKCGRCERPLVGGSTQKTGSKENAFRYQCNMSEGARQSGSCGRLQVRARDMEKVVLDVLFERLDESPELHDLVNADHLHADDNGDAISRADLMQEIRKCDEELHRLGRVASLSERHPDYRPLAEVEGQLAGFRERRAEASRDLARLKATRPNVPAPTSEDLKDVRGWFGRMGLAEKRAWLSLHISGVVVAPAASRSRYFDPGRVTPLFADPKKGGGPGQ